MGGLLVLLRGALAGSPVEVRERFDARWLLDAAPDGAHVSLVPAMLERLVATGEDLSRLGMVLVGGGRLRGALRDAAARLGARVVTTYGLTESCGGVVYDGIPFDDTAVRIADGGAIELKGPRSWRAIAAIRGDRAAFTRRRLAPHGRPRVARRRGRLVVHGRAGDAIRTGGETVWPEEVEAVLAAHPKVADVAVAGVPDAEWGTRVVAWVVPADASDPPSLEELREHSRERLARFKAPRELRIVEALPRTASGKLRRNELALQRMNEGPSEGGVRSGLQSSPGPPRGWWSREVPYGVAP